MSLKDWVRDLLGLSRKPSQSQRRRAREERGRRYHKRLRETKTPRPQLDVRISQPAYQWSQSMGELLDNRWTPIPRRAPQRGSSVPVRPPPRTYQGDSIRPRGGSVRVPPTMPRRPVEVTPSNSSMDFEIVEEIIAVIGRAFPHIPYAVTGLAAMVHHGYTQRYPRAVTILCPSTSRDVVRCWAVAQGMYRVHDDPDTFGVLTSERKMRAVRIQFVSTAAFDEVEITRTRSGGAKVVALETLAAQIARGYVADLASNSAPGHPMKRQNGYAQDMRFVLKKMVRGGERLSYRTACNIVTREFWLPFTLSFPDTVPLFEYLGLSALVDEDEEEEEEAEGEWGRVL
ncbi:hypothetical protein ACRE_058990 [Hapsidospora chrysogenum ATCC 11550]|uniref:Uncharacterized protein n=1 Tax=Hapsidospora chrysogenum (strain ATCC 11550 / CBS 779.69 / DSM 880 / IAM 14645 / JCM 23072 / IMI 49137) TaxID=857340 RepID=A0A086T1W7_HAPC1|nr:hypothetical protein ACRE_058990 [Hapsidospora chrysogenum ATCC 11550]